MREVGYKPVQNVSLTLNFSRAHKSDANIAAVKSQNTVKPNPLCRLPVMSATSRDVRFSPKSFTATSPKLPWTGSFEVSGKSPKELSQLNIVYPSYSYLALFI